MNLILRYNGLFAVDESGNFIGKIVNEATGKCCDNPTQDTPGVFDRLFGGHGYIYHQSDNPPNPFFNRDWSEVFSNPEMLPTATKNVFVDQCKDAENDFYAVEVS